MMSEYRPIHQAAIVPAYCETVSLLESHITKAIAFIHCRNLAHGDVKLTNIGFAAAAQNWMLFDFGTSSIYRKDRSRPIATGLYRDPSQYCGHKRLGFDSRQTDWWAWGVCMLQLLRMLPCRKEQMGIPWCTIAGTDRQDCAAHDPRFIIEWEYACRGKSAKIPGLLWWKQVAQIDCSSCNPGPQPPASVRAEFWRLKWLLKLPAGADKLACAFQPWFIEDQNADTRIKMRRVWQMMRTRCKDLLQIDPEERVIPLRIPLSETAIHAADIEKRVHQLRPHASQALIKMIVRSLSDPWMLDTLLKKYSFGSTPLMYQALCMRDELLLDLKFQLVA